MRKRYGSISLLLAIAAAICCCVSGCSNAASQDATTAKDSEEYARESYTCVLNTLLEAERGEEEASAGVSLQFLGMGRAFRFVNYFLGGLENSYTEIVWANSNGFPNSLTWPFEQSGYIRGMGYIAGSDGFITLSFQFPESEGGDYQYFLREHESDGDIVKTISLDFLAAPEYKQDLPQSIAADVNGFIHMAGTPDVDDCSDYYILSPAGELLWTRSFDTYSFVRLITLPDGSIACDSRKSDNRNGTAGYHHRVEQVDTTDGDAGLLFEYDEAAGTGGMAVNVFNDRKLVYANEEAVFLCDYSFENPERIFTWKKNGISSMYMDLINICADRDGVVSILASTGLGTDFLILEPKPEETHEIEFAVRPSNDFYYSAVAEFNMRHPEYKVVIRDDYDKTALLTKLIAGDGPVLIDTSLVPFQEQKKLWEPLDRVYEEMGLLDELNSGAVKLGSIDGSLYGIVTDFYIDTLVTGAAETDWDYETFIKCIEDSGNLKAIVSDRLEKVWLATCMFDHGIEDSFYVDAESGEQKFDTAEFRNLLRLIDLYGLDSDGTPVPDVTGIREGEVLCNRILLRKPEELIYCHEVYGDAANIVGFPGKNGAVSYLVSSNILAVRNTASELDKKVAAEFAGMLLSYDMQLYMAKKFSFALSVRTDVLERQINMVNKETDIYATFKPSDTVAALSGEPDNEKNGRELKELLEKSALRSNQEEYSSILAEEFDDYFSGKITEDMLIDHLDNRVGLYLKEISGQ